MTRLPNASWLKPPPPAPFRQVQVYALCGCFLLRTGSLHLSRTHLAVSGFYAESSSTWPTALDLLLLLVVYAIRTSFVGKAKAVHFWVITSGSYREIKFANLHLKGSWFQIILWITTIWLNMMNYLNCKLLLVNKKHIKYHGKLLLCNLITYKECWLHKFCNLYYINNYSI